MKRDDDWMFKKMVHFYKRYYPYVKEVFIDNDGIPHFFTCNDLKTRLRLYVILKKYYGVTNYCCGSAHQGENWFFYKEKANPDPEYVYGNVTRKDLGSDKF